MWVVYFKDFFTNKGHIYTLFPSKYYDYDPEDGAAWEDMDEYTTLYDSEREAFFPVSSVCPW